MDTKKMRECSSLLPDPGGEVVRKCLDEIERLTAHILELENELYRRRAYQGPTCRKTPVCAERADLRRRSDPALCTGSAGTARTIARTQSRG